MTNSFDEFVVSTRTKSIFRGSLYSFLSSLAMFAYIFSCTGWLFPSARVARLGWVGLSLLMLSAMLGIFSLISVMADNAKRPGRPWWMQ
jgi:uncharacterized membrane protein